MLLKNFGSHNGIIFIGLASVVLFTGGCATVKSPPSVTPIAGTPGPEVRSKTPEAVRSVQYKVRKGDTLWRIARTYGVTVNQIISANHIPNAATIENGQLLTIPGLEQIRDVSSAQDNTVRNGDFSWPVKGRLLSYFQERRGPSYNRGIDIKVDDGDLVKAARDGKVVFSDHLSGYGYAVILDHSDGFYTVYAHNEKNLVALNDLVIRGTAVSVPAREGGRTYSHFEIRKGVDASNPLYFLP